MMTRLPVNARSECVAPSTRPVGGVVEIMRMFHAACAASQRPALSPTRGSGDGAVADTIGATGGGITAGAGGGGGGGGALPRPPRPPASAAGGSAAAAPDGVDGAAADAGVLGVGAGAAVGGAVLGGGGGGALGVVDGGAAFDPELAHAGTPKVPTASSTAASRPFINSECIVLIGESPASRSSD